MSLTPSMVWTSIGSSPPASGGYGSPVQALALAKDQRRPAVGGRDSANQAAVTT